MNFGARLPTKLPKLTSHEKQMLELYKIGFNNKKIANIIGCKRASIRMSTILQKYRDILLTEQQKQKVQTKMTTLDKAHGKGRNSNPYIVENFQYLGNNERK